MKMVIKTLRDIFLIVLLVVFSVSSTEEFLMQEVNRLQQQKSPLQK